MAFLINYTSAPQLLQPGRSGFGIVACHRDIPRVVLDRAERGSQFSRAPGFPADRVVHAHRVVAAPGGAWHVLTRIRAAGADHTGRTNHLAQHIVVGPSEVLALRRADLTPAAAMLGHDWDASAGLDGWLGPEDEVRLEHLARGARDTGGAAWRALTGDARRRRILQWPGEPGILLQYPAALRSPDGRAVLELFDEAARDDPEHGWDLTFTTDAQPSDDAREFGWIALPEGSPLRDALRSGGREKRDFSSEPVTSGRSAPIRLRSGAASPPEPDAADAIAVGGPPDATLTARRGTLPHRVVWVAVIVLAAALCAVAIWRVASRVASPASPAPASAMAATGAVPPFAPPAGVAGRAPAPSRVLLVPRQVERSLGGLEKPLGGVLVETPAGPLPVVRWKWSTRGEGWQRLGLDENDGRFPESVFAALRRAGADRAGDPLALALETPQGVTLLFEVLDRGPAGKVPRELAVDGSLALTGTLANPEVRPAWLDRLDYPAGWRLALRSEAGGEDGFAAVIERAGEAWRIVREEAEPAEPATGREALVAAVIADLVSSGADPREMAALELESVLMRQIHEEASFQAWMLRAAADVTVASGAVEGGGPAAGRLAGALRELGADEASFLRIAPAAAGTGGSSLHRWPLRRLGLAEEPMAPAVREPAAVPPGDYILGLEGGGAFHPWVKVSLRR